MSRLPRKTITTVAGLTPETGGPARSVTALCTHLATADLGIELCTLSFGSQMSAPILPASPWVHTHFSSCHYSGRLRVLWSGSYQREVARHAANGASLIHDHGLWLPTNHAAAGVARHFHLPRIVSPRGMATTWAMQHHSWKKRCAWLLYQQRDLRDAALLHATSADEASDLRALGFRQPIAIIPNGMQSPPPSPPALRLDPRRTVLFLGRIHPKKGLLSLVAAWARLRPSGWRVIIAGPDENGHKAQVEKAIHAHRLQTDFTFLPMTDGDAKWSLYRQADIFVLPTFSENFGMTVAEALACERPVITTKGAPWAELQTHRCGWWVDIGIDPLTDALREALGTSDDDRAQMGRRGAQLIAQRYSWPGIAAQMRQVYDWTLGHGAMPACIHLLAA